jgi:hypothetical protein
MTTRRLLALFCLIGALTPAYAETRASVDRSNQAVVGDDGLGVELRFDADGTLLSVKSTQHHPVEFPDRRGISKAYIIAEEKAKANIARYMRQVSSSSRTVTEIDDSLSKTRRTDGSEGKSWDKENTRRVIETLQEVTGSSARAVLDGVRILERQYDEKAEEVKVVVGINRQSQAGAAQLRKGLGQTDSAQSAQGVQGAGGSFPAQPAERRRAKDADTF